MRVGQYKVPFGFQRYLRSTYYDFVDRSETMTAFSLERDVGVMILGRPLGGRLQYQLSITNGAVGGTNGAGAGKLNDNRDLAYTARVVAAPWGALPDSEGDLVGQRRPLLSVGAAGYFNLAPTDVVARSGNPQANTDLDNERAHRQRLVWQGGVELRVHFRGAALQAELFRRLEHPGAGWPTAPSGASTCRRATSWFHTSCPRRARRAHRPAALRRDPGAAQGQRRSHRWADRGRQRLPARARSQRARYKIQADYTHLRTTDVVSLLGPFYSPDSHRLRVTAQLMF